MLQDSVSGLRTFEGWRLACQASINRIRCGEIPFRSIFCRRASSPITVVRSRIVDECQNGPLHWVALEAVAD